MLRPILLALPAALALAACATPTPEGMESWHRLTQQDRDTTSQCIGRPASPLCAVETLLACFQRGRIELCREVDDGADLYGQVFASPPARDRYLAYRVLVLQTVRGPLPEGLAQPGDVLISLDQREATVGQPIPAEGGPSSDFLLRRQPDGKWKIIGWGGPGE